MFLQTIKKIMVKGFYPIIECFPTNLADKIKVIGCIMTGKWRFYHYDGIADEIANEITEDEVDKTYHDIDAESLLTIKRFFKSYQMRKLNFPSREFERYFIINAKIYNQVYESNKELEKAADELKETRKAFGFGDKYHLGPESLFYHHGLRELPEAVKEYIHGKTFIDAGAYVGDSTLVFIKNYAPMKVIAFEPSKKNRDEFLHVMRSLRVPASKYEVSEFALTSQCSSISFMERNSASTVFSNQKIEYGSSPIIEIKSVSLDVFMKDRSDTVGVIKADVEGACLELVKGAMNTIRKHRPVLTLAIYHSKEEFLGVYQYLKEAGLDYHFSVRWLSNCIYTELTLIAFPNELLRVRKK